MSIKRIYFNKHSIAYVLKCFSQSIIGITNNSACQFTHAYTMNRTGIPIFLLSNKTNKKNQTRSVIFSIAAAGSLEDPNRVSVRGCEIVDSSNTNENLRPMRCGQEDIYVESTCIVQPKPTNLILLDNIRTTSTSFLISV